MAGLYIHIPFCKSRCIYCGFYSTTRLEMQDRYTDALCSEMALRTSTDVIETVYIGGGTPSQLSAHNLNRLLLYINKVYKVAADAEITIECNPDNVTPQLSMLLQSLGVNRVSMGAQTFSDQRLRFLHRRHTAAQVAKAVNMLRQADINNISIDLMFGFPGETVEEWLADIDAALALQVEHLSAYCLMYEEGTPLYKHKPTRTDADEERERNMYELLIDRLTAAGFEHYEISNFARRKAGDNPLAPSPFRSRHNSAYWQGIPYIGIGAAAHSYNITSRSWNKSNLLDYINSIEHHLLPSESETLDAATRYNDLVTTAMRTVEGINIDTLEPQMAAYLLENAQRSINQHLLELNNGHLHLTRQGLFVSDNVMSDLIFI